MAYLGDHNNYRLPLILASVELQSDFADKKRQASDTCECTSTDANLIEFYETAPALEGEELARPPRSLKPWECGRFGGSQRQKRKNVRRLKAAGVKPKKKK